MDAEELPFSLTCCTGTQEATSSFKATCCPVIPLQDAGKPAGKRCPTGALQCRGYQQDRVLHPSPRARLCLFF